MNSPKDIPLFLRHFKMINVAFKHCRKGNKPMRYQSDANAKELNEVSKTESCN